MVRRKNVRVGRGRNRDAGPSTHLVVVVVVFAGTLWLETMNAEMVNRRSRGASRDGRDRSRDASKKDFVRTKRKSGLPRPLGTHRLARGPRCFRETFESAFLRRAVRLRSRRWMGSGARGKGQIRVFVSSSVSKRCDAAG